MADEATKTSSWKIWTVGVCIIVAGISSCTTKILTGGNPADAVTQGATDAKQGYDVIKSGELPSQ